MPDAHITWAVESPSHQLLEGHAALDAVIKIPKGWLKSVGKFRETRRQLRAQPFDLVFDPQSLTKSAALGWVSGCGRRVGLARPQGREFAPWLNNERVEPTEEHIVPRSLELLRVLGVKRPEVEFNVPIHETAVEAMQQFLLRQRLRGGFAAINPSASWPSKRWELDRFAQVATHLRTAHGLRTVVVWAGEEERAMAQSIVDQSGGAALLAPPRASRSSPRCR
ncbi:MAG: glycosyltransferase family 9 protein [Pirellulaceae bacterium]